MKTKKYFGEKPIEGPIAFGDMYKRAIKSSNNSRDTNNRDYRNNYYPSPEQLAEYERISEGSSSHIIALLDKEQINRQRFSQKSLNAKIVSHRLAMVLSFISVVFITGSAAYLALEGYEIQSIILSVASLASIVATYKYNKSNSPNPFRRNFSKNKKSKNR